MHLHLSLEPPQYCDSCCTPLLDGIGSDSRFSHHGAFCDLCLRSAAICIRCGGPVFGAGFCADCEDHFAAH